ncbi:hypothetical protein [Streptomyces paromomycinus]|uniref:Secreted protein n=1 Tax=Streptomyces paromomycinus TaxID=92743 RepID=A0A401VTN1_STREY|nr:hypothetical protein [Streptomyces paromomycinus]GCD40440.1 hypothetical protein GKJPGBOP_00089 [Streptomyces paromomycinus]
MKIRLAKTLTGAALGAALCVTGAVPPASAQERPNHWDNGYVPYPNGRVADTDQNFAAVASVGVEWEGYKVSLSGTVWDRAADGYGVRMEVGYHWQNGAAWEWTTRIFGKAEGGMGDSKSSSAHSRAGVNIKGLKVRACTVNRANQVVACSSWA